MGRPLPRLRWLAPPPQLQCRRTAGASGAASCSSWRRQSSTSGQHPVKLAARAEPPQYRLRQHCQCSHVARLCRTAKRDACRIGCLRRRRSTSNPIKGARIREGRAVALTQLPLRRRIPPPRWATNGQRKGRLPVRQRASAPETAKARLRAGNRRSPSAQCSTSEVAPSVRCCSLSTARMFCARSPLGPCTSS